MTQRSTPTKAYVVIIDNGEVLLLAASDRRDALRRLITDLLIKGQEQRITADDVFASLANGFITVHEINGGVFAEPWNGVLPEGL